MNLLHALRFATSALVLVASSTSATDALEGAAKCHRRVPPFDETREYVRRVIGRVRRAAQPFDAGVTEPSPQLQRMRKVANVD